MIRSGLVFIFFVCVGFAGYMFFHLGALKDVAIAIQERPVTVLLYKEFMGPYHKTVTAIEEVETWAQSQKIDCRLSFGKYLDNPESIEEGRLRSWGGCVLPSTSGVSIEDLIKNLPPLPNGFKISQEPAGRFVVAEFMGSPGIGPLKVYPRVNEFMKDQKLEQVGSVIEIYEILDRESKREMKTTYLFQMAQ